MGDAVSSLVNANMLKASKHVLIMSKLIIPSPFLSDNEQHWHCTQWQTLRQDSDL